MKKFIIICCLIQITNNCYSQHINELTNQIVGGFTKAHPTAKEVEWKFLDSNFIAVFKDKGHSIEKTYSKTGKLIRTKLEIDPSFLPKSSSDFMARFYGSSNTYKAFKLFDDFSKVSYFVEIDSTKLCFDINGSFLNRESLKN